MIKLILISTFFILTTVSVKVFAIESKIVDDLAGETFLQKYPHIAQHIYTEPPSNFFFAFSVGAFGVLKDRMLFSANFFQIHKQTPGWDYELFSVSFGTTTTKPSYVQSDHFIFRSIPKMKFGETFSFGPLIGYEFVSFRQINAKLLKNSFETPSEAFSTKGVIWGLGASENFTLESGTKLKISQLLYKQTYSTEKADRGWSYLYGLQELRKDPTPIEASLVFLLEVGFLY